MHLSRRALTQLVSPISMLVDPTRPVVHRQGAFQHLGPRSDEKAQLSNATPPQLLSARAVVHRED